MRHAALGLLCALGLSAQAATTDFVVSKEPNGFNVYEVTKDAVKKVTGSPFGSSLTQFAWTNGTYIYAVDWVATPTGGPDSYEAAQIVSYTASATPHQVAALADNTVGVGGFGNGGCGHCYNHIITAISGTQHEFLVMNSEGGEGIYSYIATLHTHSDGKLSYMCNLGMPLAPMVGTDYNLTVVTNVRTDANGFYAYVDYVDPETTIPETAIFDISTGPCKRVGTIAQ